MNLARRHLLLGLAACPICAGAARSAEGPHWNYGDEGPEKWASLDPANSVCSAGDQQSPVDLHDGVRVQLPAISPNWRSDPLKVTNNGHTLQLNTDPGSNTAIGDGRAELVQFHFHTPSEHAVEGRRSAMEAHFVHKLGDGLAVLGVLLSAGPANSAFHAIMAAAPAKTGEAGAAQAFDPRTLLPRDLGAAWRYEGSLTTPPCSQTVAWVVFEESVTVAQADIDAFKAIFPMNARPLQPLNRRFLLRG
ncbi:MAG TPA: carbonic anhydrase family protein [Caulobacteraceae bacterium]|jgi:carbonic anhydrase